MDIVYKLTFTKRKQANQVPYQYIGSKSNCTVIDGVIYDKKGKPYFGSSKWKDYKELVNEDIILVEILYEGSECGSYNDLLLQEKRFHEQEDVVADPTYFNLQLATVSSFANPNFATYKHTLSEKVVRLPRNHPKVLSGEYVGHSKGVQKWSAEDKALRSERMRGENNPFYGKSHPKELIEHIALQNRGRKASEETKKKMSKSRVGKAKSEAHKKAIGLASKGKISLKNSLTGETLRVSKEAASSLDPLIWVNPYKLRDKSPSTCPHCGLTKPKSSTFTRWHFDNCKEKR